MSIDRVINRKQQKKKNMRWCSEPDLCAMFHHDYYRTKIYFNTFLNVSKINDFVQISLLLMLCISLVKIINYDNFFMR